MAQPLEATFPQFLNLPDGYILRFDAVDPLTGASVAGVQLQDVSIFAQHLGNIDTGGLGDLMTGPWQLVYTNLG